MTESVAITRTRGARAKLILEDLSSPVVARVEQCTAERMTVKQALPFLRLESGVRDEEGRRAVIRSVGVCVEGGTPNLVLDLVYDERATGPSDPSIGLDDTLPAPIVIEPRRPPRRVDHTIPYGFLRRKDRTDLAVAHRQRGALEPEDAMRCYLLTRKKPEPPVVIEAESGRHVHRERTQLFGPDERHQLATNPAAVAPVAPPAAAGGAQATTRPTVAARARALAGAFWGYWVDRRSPSRRSR